MFRLLSIATPREQQRSETYTALWILTVNDTVLSTVIHGVWSDYIKTQINYSLARYINAAF